MGLTEKRLNELKEMWQTIEEAVTSKHIMKRCGKDVWTDEQVEEERLNWYAYEDFKEQQRRRDVEKRVREMQKEDGSIYTQIITICVDQNVSEESAVKVQTDVITEIRKANYKWLKGTDAKAVFEYYSKEKDTGKIKWNPHIHIYLEKTIKDGALSQSLRTKLCGRKGEKTETTKIYRVHVKSGQGNIQLDYINGTKTEAKFECCEKDKAFREKYEIQEIIDI